MFRQSGNSAAPASRSGEVLTTSSGGGAGTDVNLIEVGGSPIALGQTTMAASLPVVIASDQSPIPITGSISATNPSVAATGAAVPADATYVGINIGGNLVGPVGGHGTAAGALRVELPTDGTGVLATVGAVTAITNALPAGSNVIGHVIADTGSTTAVTGNVTVIQPTGTNLHTVIDSGSVTVVQPTAANLNATVTVAAGSAVIGHVITDSGSVTAAVLTTGSAQIGHLEANQSVNLAQVNGTATQVNTGAVGTGTQRVAVGTDTATIAGSAPGTAGTASANVVTVQGVASMTPVQVSQATASNLNAQVVGSIASDSVDSGNPVKIGFIAATAAPTAVAALDRVNGLADVWGRLYVRDGMQAPVASTFTQIHVPSTNVQATKTQGSAGTGKRNVCTGFTVTMTAGASAITAAAPLIVSVIDGTTGGSTYLWRSYINIPATAGMQVSIQRSNIWLVGSQATSLTVEFSAAGGSNSYESVAFDGVIVEE